MAGVTPGAVDKRSLAMLGLTLALGVAGGLGANAAGLPAGLMSGAMAAVAVAAIAGVPVWIPDTLRQVAFVAIGIVLGASVTPETLALLPRWPASLAGLAVCVAVLMVVLPAYLVRVHGLDVTTARMATFPGAFSYVLGLSIEYGADTRRVAIIQTLRLALLIVVIPVAVHVTTPQGESPGPDLEIIAWGSYAALFMVCAAASFAGQRIGVPSAAFVVPVFVSVAAYGVGLVEGRSPDIVAWPALIVLGTLIGARFAGTAFSFLKASVKMGAANLMIAVLISLGFAAAISWLLDLPLVQVWLAFSPGGMDTMTVLAFSLGVDPAFVAGHQFLRFIALNLMVPFLFRRVQREPGGKP